MKLPLQLNVSKEKLRLYVPFGALLISLTGLIYQDALSIIIPVGTACIFLLIGVYISRHSDFHDLLDCFRPTPQLYL
jgi:hypothetical protein